MRDFNNVVLQLKAQKPDLVIPSSYYNEYVLLARSIQQQRARPKAIYSILGGGASSYRFVKEFPDAANLIMDCTQWFNPNNPKALALMSVGADGAVAVRHRSDGDLGSRTIEDFIQIAGHEVRARRREAAKPEPVAS